MLLGLGSLSAAAARSFPALAKSDYPQRPIRLIVPRSAGGGLYLITDHVQGPPLTSLAQIVSTGARRTAFAAAARDLSDALAYLHATLVPGGCVAVHDYGHFSSGAKKAVDRFVDEHRDAYEFRLPYASAWGLAILKRKGA